MNLIKKIAEVTGIKQYIKRYVEKVKNESLSEICSFIEKQNTYKYNSIISRLDEVETDIANKNFYGYKKIENILNSISSENLQSIDRLNNLIEKIDMSIKNNNKDIINILSNFENNHRTLLEALRENKYLLNDINNNNELLDAVSNNRILINELALSLDKYKDDLVLIQRKSTELAEISDQMNLRINGKKNKKIIFLIHHIGAIDSIITVIEEAIARKHKVVVISIKNKFSTDSNVFQVHEGLNRLNLEHLRFDDIDSYTGLSLIKAMAPDVIFRQASWDGDIDDGYSTENLKFTKLCYIPYYGIQITKDFMQNDTCDNHVDQPLHRYAWAIFKENSQSDKDYTIKHALMGDLNVVAAGVPKYEYICRELNKYKNHTPNKPTVLWAPHHSFGKDWLGFGTFPVTYEAILDAVRRLELALIFRPHPLFRRNLLKVAHFPEKEYLQFMDKLQSIPDCVISSGNDPLEDFAASSLLLTDGISFLASYQFTGKPLIWMESKMHRPLTISGQKMADGCIIIPEDDISVLASTLQTALNGGFKEVAAKSREFVNMLVGKVPPSKKIISYLEKNA